MDVSALVLAKYLPVGLYMRGVLLLKRICELPEDAEL
jgi:hypothetical protein